MQPLSPTPVSSLLDFSTPDLMNHYPNLPAWAIDAFHALKEPQQKWTAEARALLNMANIPPTSNALIPGPKFRAGTKTKDLRGLFETEEEWEKAKEELDLWRLSTDLNAAKEEGWAQSKGCSKML